MTSADMSPADFSAMMGNGDGFGGNNAWWIILLFLFVFWGGRGFGGQESGAMQNYVLNSDFSELSRQLDSATDRLATQGNSIANGLCDGFYTQAQLINGVNQNIAQNGYESRLATQNLQSAMQSCCCDMRQQIADVNYNMAMNSNATQNAISSGFCTTNFNAQSNTRDLIDNQNANARAILDAINANKVEALKERIAEQNQQINSLQLSASQHAQNEYLIGQLGQKYPVPAYITCNPNAVYNGCGCA